MSDHKDILRQTNQALDKMLEEKRRIKNEEDRKYLVSSIGKDLSEVLKPSLEEMIENSRLSRENLKEIISEIKVEAPKVDVPQVYVTVPEIKVPEAKVTVEIPEIKIPEIKLPTIKVPKPEVTVNIPEIKIPDFEFPEPVISIPEDLSVGIKGVDRNNPLHVILTDSKGNPYSAQPVITSGGGGGGGVMTGFDGSGNKKVLVDSTGRLITSAASDVTGSINVVQLGGNDIATNSGVANSGTLRVVQVTDSVVSVNVVSGSATNTEYNDGATPDQAGGKGVIMMLFDGGSAQSWSGSSYGIASTQITDFDGSSVTLDVKQVSGSIWSTTVTNDANSLIVNQVSGSSWSTSASIDAQTVTLDTKQVSGSVDSVIVNSFLTSLEVKQVSGSVDSISIVSSDITLEVKQVSGSVNSVAVNSIAADQLIQVRQVSGSSDSVVVNSFLTSLDVKQISGSTDSINIIQVNGNTISTDDGIADSGTLRVTNVSAATATTAAVSVGADASTSVVVSNSARRSIVITHASSSNLYVATGTAASTTSIPLVTNQSISFDDYTGPINAIAEEQAGTISVRYIEIV